MTCTQVLKTGIAGPEIVERDAHTRIRRFLMHTLPDGFHRIRHYGLFANAHRAEKLALCQRLLHPRAETAKVVT